MLTLPPQPTSQAKPITLDQIVISKQQRNQNPPESSDAPNNSSSTTKLIRPPPTPLRQPPPRRTNPIIWFAATLCLIFSIVLIFFGIATLTIFLAVKPRTPTFDAPSANLNAVYFDSPEYFNGDFTLLANFTNPNRRIDVRFESLDVGLFFSGRLISAQSIEPFSQRRRESRVQPVRFISSLVFLPQEIGVRLQEQVQSNRVHYDVRGTFRVKVTVGLIHVSYLLHSTCQIEMTGPPTGVLVARNCMTKR